MNEQVICPSCKGNAVEIAIPFELKNLRDKKANNTLDEFDKDELDFLENEFKIESDKDQQYFCYDCHEFFGLSSEEYNKQVKKLFRKEMLK